MRMIANACFAAGMTPASSPAQISPALLPVVARQSRGIIFKLLFILVFVLSMGNAYALAVTYGGMNRLTDPNDYANGNSWFGGLALVQPGNKAFIDDHYINVGLGHGVPVPGDAYGTRVTNPSGSVFNNILTMGADGCWRRLLTTICTDFRSLSGRFGTGIHMGVLGQWKMEVISNGATVYTDYFTLSPYLLNENSGNNQSISLQSVTPKPLQVKLLDPAGAPAGNKSVVFTVTSAPKGTSNARLTDSSSYTGTGSTSLQATTDAAGMAKVYLQSANKTGSYSVTATSTLAPDTTLNFTVKAVKSNLLDQIAKEKNLGADPSKSSNCGDAPASATSLSTPNPINIATGIKFRAESDYIGGGDLPLQFMRYYNSMSPRAGSMGANWRSYYDREIKFVTTATKGRKTTTVAEVLRPDGKVLKFTANNGAWTSDADVVDRLATVAGGYSYTCGKDQIEVYSSAGKLLSISTRDGVTQSLSYDTLGRLTSVQVTLVADWNTDTMARTG